MLFSFNDIRQFAIQASDGRKGHAKDLYFDDASWQVSYAVVESGFLFTKQEGLLKSTLLGNPDIENRALPISLTKTQLQEADSPETHPTVSDQQERNIRLRQLEYWPPLMIGAPGAVYTPATAEHQLRTGDRVPERKPEEELAELEDPHLRSLNEVSGYGITATDGDIGSISDFLLDPNGWRIRYIVVDTGNWLPGRQVAIRPDWVSHISWDGQNIVVSATKEEVSDAPEISQIDELERSDANMALAPYGAYAGFAP